MIDLNHNNQYFNQKLPWQFEHDGFGSLGITSVDLVMISPDQYFEDIVKLVGTHTELDAYPHDSDLIEDMKTRLSEQTTMNSKENHKWDIPYILIDTSTEKRSSQDGRHRMAVMKEMNVELVPCLYLYKTKKRKKNLHDHELLLDSPEGYFLPEMLSLNNGKKENGYLVCTNVVAARTGIQKYYGKEMFPNNKKYLNDVFYLERTSEEVFDPKSIASFNGAAFTDGHPKGGRVNSKNSKELSKGMVTNPRKADFLDDDGNELLLVDIIIQDEAVIKAVEKGKKQVSVGYGWDFEVVDFAARRLRVTNIRANHLALVGKGRAKTAMIMDSIDDDIIEIKEIILDEEVKELSLIGGENMADEKVYKFSLKDSGEVIEARGFDSEEDAEEVVMQYYKEKEEKEEK